MGYSVYAYRTYAFDSNQGLVLMFMHDSKVEPAQGVKGSPYIPFHQILEWVALAICVVLTISIFQFFRPDDMEKSWGPVLLASVIIPVLVYALAVYVIRKKF